MIKKILFFYLAPPLLLLLLGIGLTYLINRTLKYFKRSKETRLKTGTICMSVVVTLSVAELFMRVTGKYSTYSERELHSFWSPYDFETENTLRLRPPLHRVALSADEFSYWRMTNSLGFSDKEFSTRKDSNEIKILCLGDSFTEGFGAPYDSSYPYMLHQILQRRFTTQKFTVMNGGISGSDPFFNFRDYDSLLYRFHPDIIIQSFAWDDWVYDMNFWGGFDRFTAQGTLQPHCKFRLAPLFQLSYLSRIYFRGILKLNDFYVSDDNFRTQMPYFHKQLRELIKRWEEETAQKNITVFFIDHPNDYDCKNTVYHPLFLEYLSFFKQQCHTIHTADLLPFYTDSVHMQQDIHKFFWKKNKHHTPVGYYWMARGTANIITGAVQQKIQERKSESVSPDNHLTAAVPKL